MSSFIVSDKHINTIITGVTRIANYSTLCTKEQTYSLHNLDDLQTLASLLLEENYKSVNARYGENNTPHKIEFRFTDITPPDGIHPAVQLLKLINCLEYQSCDHDDYFESHAYDVLKRMKERVILALPGYDEAQWSL